jgi:hypothetical protein
MKDGRHRANITRYIDIEVITEPPLPKGAVRIVTNGSKDELFISAHDGAKLEAFLRHKGNLKVNATGLQGKWARISLYEGER